MKFQCRLLHSYNNNPQLIRQRSTSPTKSLVNPLKTELKTLRCSNCLLGPIMHRSNHPISRKSNALSILSPLTSVWYRDSHGSANLNKAIWISIQILFLSIKKFSDRWKIIFKVTNQRKVNKSLRKLKEELIEKAIMNEPSNKAILRSIKIVHNMVKNLQLHNN